MPALPVTRVGRGPDLVLLHGVGLGPTTFARLADVLAVDHRVLLVDRDAMVAGRALVDQADDIATTLAEEGCTAPVVVGVSGGATLGLVLGLRHPDVTGGLVLHEPLVGPRATVLSARFAAAAASASADDAAALAVVRTVMGERTWAELDPAARVRVAAGAARARHEIPLFAAFAPSDDDLMRLRSIPVLTTVGGASGPERHAAAQVLHELAGAATVVVDRAGNAVQLDAPEQFADVIRAWRPLSTWSGR